MRPFSWNTDSYWFDVAVVTSLLMLGHMFLGRFSEHQSRWWRLFKSVAGLALIVGASVLFGRTWLWVLIGVIAAMLLFAHGWWLPRKGVNGWTAEPRDRYYELMGLDPAGKPAPKQ